MNDELDNTLIKDVNAMSLVGKTDDDLYAMAHKELGGEERRPGVWARSISDAMGDIPKAEALYIRYRAEQLVSERQEQPKLKAIQERAAVINIWCPRCDMPVDLTLGFLADIADYRFYGKACPYCKKPFNVHKVVSINRNYLDYLRLLDKTSGQKRNKPLSLSDSAASSGPPKTNTIASTRSESGPKMGLAVASLVCGIIGGWASTLSLPAVICGHMALNKISKDSTKYGGKGMAIAGLILGYLGIILSIALGTMRGWVNIQLRDMGY